MVKKVMDDALGDTAENDGGVHLSIEDNVFGKRAGNDRGNVLPAISLYSCH